MTNERTHTERNTSKSKPDGFFQPKLAINQANDAHEQEADAIADKVMRMAIPSRLDSFFKPANPFIQRKCACEEEGNIQRKENSTTEVGGSNELDNYVSSLSSSGQSLPESSRSFFEPRFGQNFSHVKIHTGSVAAKSAQSINAVAYTTGNNIVFNEGQYSPNTESGQRLMAHELTHVVQQRGTNTSVQKAEEAPKCDMVSTIPSSERYNFIVSTDSFTSAAEEQRLRTKLSTIDMATSIDVLGMASADGPEANNETLSCKRAEKVATIITSSGHTVNRVKATGGYPGSAHDSSYRAVALNYNTPEKPKVCDKTPPPAPVGPGIPRLRDPHIIGGGQCRDACGTDCPPTCAPMPDVVKCVPDSTGSCYFTYTYTDVINCGSHLGCRIHDACYDACEAAGHAYGWNDICHRKCDVGCVNTYDFSRCNSWREGGGPFDSHILFSNPPVISAPIPGVCPP